ncbi:MAG: 50S ribosomal protein L18 [Desulfobacterales bacterium]|nr:50S ribosomal protein L18 [Desulfobacterales bacterium]
MGSLDFRKKARIKRKKRIRKNLFGTDQRPRLSVFRSSKHIYAQIIDDICGYTLVAASSVEKDVKENSEINKDNKIAVANFVGKILADRAIEKGVKKVVFDRNGFLYHGRIKAVSDGARKAGLEF